MPDCRLSHEALTAIMANKREMDRPAGPGAAEADAGTPEPECCSGHQSRWRCADADLRSEADAAAAAGPARCRATASQSTDRRGPGSNALRPDTARKPPARRAVASCPMPPRPRRSRCPLVPGNIDWPRHPWCRPGVAAGPRAGVVADRQRQEAAARNPIRDKVVAPVEGALDIVAKITGGGIGWHDWHLPPPWSRAALPRRTWKRRAARCRHRARHLPADRNHERAGATDGVRPHGDRRL